MQARFRIAKSEIGHNGGNAGFGLAIKPLVFRLGMGVSHFLWESTGRTWGSPQVTGKPMLCKIKLTPLVFSESSNGQPVQAYPATCQ